MSLKMNEALPKRCTGYWDNGLQHDGDTCPIHEAADEWNICDEALCPRPVFPNFDSTFCNEHQEYENE